MQFALFIKVRCEFKKIVKYENVETCLRPVSATITKIIKIMESIPITLAKTENLESLVNLNTEYFARSEQTNKILKIPIEMYRIYAEHITQKALLNKQLLIAKDNDEIIGYLIWEDYCHPLYEGMTPNPDVYKLIAPELKFVELLEENLINKHNFNENECARLLQVAVIQEYQNSGIAKILAIEAINNIISRKYKCIIADCTADNSYQILLNFGFETISEISYSEFEYEGVKTFGELAGKRRLVLKRL